METEGEREIEVQDQEIRNTEQLRKVKKKK